MTIKGHRLNRATYIGKIIYDVCVVCANMRIMKIKSKTTILTLFPQTDMSFNLCHICNSRNGTIGDSRSFDPISHRCPVGLHGPFLNLDSVHHSPSCKLFPPETSLHQVCRNCKKIDFRKHGLNTALKFKKVR